MAYSYSLLNVSSSPGTFNLSFWEKTLYLLIAIYLIIFTWFMLFSSQVSQDGNSFTIPVKSNDVLVSNTVSATFDLNVTIFGPSPKVLNETFPDGTFDLELDFDKLKQSIPRELDSLWSPPNNFFNFLPVQILSCPHKKVISFSLYGKSQRYLSNAVKIIRAYKKLLPDWISRFWIGSDVSYEMIVQLILEGAEVIIVRQRKPENGTNLRVPSYHGMFWRFFVADDRKVERYIVRDADSLPIKREIDAMNEWIKENTDFHVMRDHKEHNIEILGGMWGGKVNRNIFSASKEYKKALQKGYNLKDGKGVDQFFLREYLWPIAKSRMTCHTAYRWEYIDSRGCKDFPTKREGTDFIGAIIRD